MVKLSECLYILQKSAGRERWRRGIAERKSHGWAWERVEVERAGRREGLGAGVGRER